MNYEDLTPEQKEKAKACKTPDDIFALAEESGYKLTKEELEGVTGGGGCWDADGIMQCTSDSKSEPEPGSGGASGGW